MAYTNTHIIYTNNIYYNTVDSGSSSSFTWDPTSFYVYNYSPYKEKEKHPLDKAFTPEQKKKFEGLFI